MLLGKVRNAIRNSRLFSFTGHHKSKREWWESFFRLLPLTVDPVEYLDQLREFGILFEEPCAQFIYNSEYKSSPVERCKWVLSDCSTGLEPILAGFSLPEVLAVSGNCVSSEFNRHPVHPRLYSMRDVTLQVYYPY